MGKPTGLLAIAAMLVLAGPAAAQQTATAQQLAFPEAEGHGRFSRGGRGGAVLTVTNTNDAGVGSMRAAVEAKGPRTVVFAVSGTIQLKSPLKVAHPGLTVAGQTAPGDGITLADQPLILEADDVIIRYIRVRLGDASGVEQDAVTISHGSRIILDHVSASWSVDETLSVGSRYASPEAGVYDVTVQWSVISESLNRSVHAKGRHGYGSLIRAGHGARFSFHHNLWASHQARMPRPGNYNGPDQDPVGGYIEFRNNVFYNWGGESAGYNADKATLSAYDFVGNTYIPGPQSKGRLAFCEQNSLSRAFFADNALDGQVPTDPWSLVGCTPPTGYRSTAPLADSGVKTSPPALGRRQVLDQAGASLVRDAVDVRVIAGVRDRSGRLIDSQGEVGGWPEIRTAPAAADADQDGMPDAWERANGLDPADPTDRNGISKDGYTFLEIYLNGLVARPD